MRQTPRQLGSSTYSYVEEDETAAVRVADHSDGGQAAGITAWFPPGTVTAGKLQAVGLHDRISHIHVDERFRARASEDQEGGEPAGTVNVYPGGYSDFVGGDFNDIFSHIEITRENGATGPDPDPDPDPSPGPGPSFELLSLDWRADGLEVRLQAVFNGEVSVVSWEGPDGMTTQGETLHWTAPGTGEFDFTASVTGTEGNTVTETVTVSAVREEQNTGSEEAGESSRLSPAVLVAFAAIGFAIFKFM